MIDKLLFVFDKMEDSNVLDSEREMLLFVAQELKKYDAQQYANMNYMAQVILSTGELDIDEETKPQQNVHKRSSASQHSTSKKTTKTMTKSTKQRKNTDKSVATNHDSEDEGGIVDEPEDTDQTYQHTDEIEDMPLDY